MQGALSSNIPPTPSKKSPNLPAMWAWRFFPIGFRSHFFNFSLDFSGGGGGNLTHSTQLQLSIERF